jgi:tetratricopeptide (TPR) repeat protein
MNFFETNEFKQVLSRYEQSRREGNSCYLDSDDFIDISDYYLDLDKPLDSLDAVNEGIRLHPNDELLISVKAGVLIYLHQFEEAGQLVENLDPANNHDVKYLQAQLKYAVEEDVEGADALFHEWLRDVENEWQYGENHSRNFSTEDDSEDDFEEPISDEDAERELRSAYIHVMMSYMELSNIDADKQIREWVESYFNRFSDFGEYESDYAVADIVRECNFSDFTETAYTRLLDYNPYLDNGWLVLAMAQNMQGKYEESLNSLDFALAINPNDETSLVAKAHCFYSLGNYQKALEVFLKVRKMNNASPAADQYIAFCYSAMGDKKNALLYLDSARQYLKFYKGSNAQKAYTMSEIADGYFTCGAYEDAKPLAEKAHKLDRSRMEYVQLLGNIYLGLNDLKHALSNFIHYINNSENTAAAMLYVAQRFLAFDYAELASELLKCVLKYDEKKDDFPQKNSALAYMSLAKFRNGELEEAFDFLQQACEKDADSVKKLYANYLPDSVLPQDYFDYLKKQLTSEA